MPCGRPSTPTDSVSGSYAWPATTIGRLILEDLEDHAAAGLRRRGREDRAQRLGGPTLLREDLVEDLLRGLQRGHERGGLGDLLGLDLFGVVDQAAGQVVDQIAKRRLTGLSGS